MKRVTAKREEQMAEARRHDAANLKELGDGG